MKKTSLVIVAVLFLAIASTATAKNEAGSQNLSQDSTTTNTPGVSQATATPPQQMKASPSPSGKAVQNTNQVKTQNKGEDSQLKVSTQEKEVSGSSESEKEATKSGSPRTDSAKEHMSIVAQTVEALLSNKTIQGGVGDQIREIAQAQQQAQDQIQAELGKIEGRNGLVKSLMGPDYKALKNMQKQMEQNQLRIKQLEQLMSQLTNQGDIATVQTAIQTLTEQNTMLQDKVSLEEQSGSLLGWFFKLFI